jgi:hypothetical protein
MHMQMVDCLAAVFGRVDHYPISFKKLIVAGQICAHPEQMSEQCGVFFAGFGKRSQMFTRDNQDVNRRLGMDIGEGVAFVILVNGSRRDASFDDPAEKAAHNRISVQELIRSGRAGEPFQAEPSSKSCKGSKGS